MEKGFVMRQAKANLEIDDIFNLQFGLVFTVLIIEGEFKTGDIIEFKINEEVYARKILGINTGTILKDGFSCIGIMIETFGDEDKLYLRNWKPQRSKARVF
jgi:hypothetical protein